MTNDIKIPDEFSDDGMNLWIRIVNKRKKILSILNTAESIDDLDKDQQKLLSDIFLTEIGSYGPMMFNISSKEVSKF